MKNYGNPAFERAFASAVEKFPKLKSRFDAKTNFWIVDGELDICDMCGVYWGSFDIQVLIPQTYPYCVPIVQEVSTHIPRSIDWHVDENGMCCIDICHRLIYMARCGIDLPEFMLTKVYPFFANQLFKLECGNYAGQEFQHHFAGVRQFYEEELDLDLAQAVLTLRAIINRTFGRNMKCPCGSSQKLKRCHLRSLTFLRCLGVSQLHSDLASFQALG